MPPWRSPLHVRVRTATFLVGGFAAFVYAPATGPEPPPFFLGPTADSPITVTHHGIVAQAFAEEATADIPLRLAIPRLAIDAPIVQLGLLPDGKLDAPTDGQHAGWYKDGPRPGQPGTAVIDGHLTLHHQPGIFWRLHQVKTGDDILVTDASGILRTFRVHRTESYHVHNAPLEEIFASPGGHRLHLITCAGRWDPALDHYDRRLIVFAELAEE